MGIRNDNEMEKLTPVGIDVKQFQSWLEDNVCEDTEVARLDGFDECVLGVSFDGEHLIYDTQKMIETIIGWCSSKSLIETDEEKHQAYEDAWEYFSYNILGLCFSEGNPIFLNRFEPDWGGKVVDLGIDNEANSTNNGSPL